MKIILSAIALLFISTSIAFAQLDSNQLEYTVSINGMTDQQVIRFDSNATFNFDPLYDAYKFMNSAKSPSFFSALKGNEYSINTMPASFSEIILPLVLAAPIAGDYSFSAGQVHPFDNNISITLIDSLYHIQQDLKKQPVYNFTLAGRDTLTNRFYIKFTKQNTNRLSALTAVIVKEPENTINLYAYKETVTIVNDNTYSLEASVIIYNLLGERVYEQDAIRIADNTNYKIDLSSLPTNTCYLLNLITPNLAISKRIILEQ